MENIYDSMDILHSNNNFIHRNISQFPVESNSKLFGERVAIVTLLSCPRNSSLSDLDSYVNMSNHMLI